MARHTQQLPREVVRDLLAIARGLYVTVPEWTPSQDSADL